MNTDFPLDTLVQGYWLPEIRATVHLRRSEPDQALEALRETSAYELSMNGGLSVVYLRGLVFLDLHQGRETVGEFQKILDHPGIVLMNDCGALAHLGIARAYVLQGDSTKAKAAYQDFLALWKDADPEIPIVKQAKAEYAKLR